MTVLFFCDGLCSMGLTVGPGAFGAGAPAIRRNHQLASGLVMSGHPSLTRHPGACSLPFDPENGGDRAPMWAAPLLPRR